MERMMGKDFTPVRKIFDYALAHQLSGQPVVFVLTVCTAPGGKIRTHGLFLGDTRRVLEEAVRLSQEKNIDFVEHGIRKCVVYLDPAEFKSTWLGNKAIYRTRMSARSRSTPSPPISRKPAVMHTSAGIPFFPHSSATDSALEDGTESTARSTLSGISRTDA